MSSLSDSASGSAAGYLFQFEKALSMLATLDSGEETVSIEKLDDVAVENESSLVLVAVQAKHSIAADGTTFEDTSEALWRTLQIWIEKLKSGVFNKKTKFICATNKKIPEKSLLRELIDKPQDQALEEIQSIYEKQKLKLEKLKAKSEKSGKKVTKVIGLIEFALSNKDALTTIIGNLNIEDESDPKSRFLNAIHMSGDSHTQIVKSNFFHTMYGWITDSSRAKWLNAENAVFSKADFDRKLALTRTNPSIANAIFRHRDQLGEIDLTDLSNAKQELFVKQIEDIKRNSIAKERIVQNAILDFIYHDIELKHIITQGDLTEEDFVRFKQQCKSKWQVCADNHILLELENYNEDDINTLAITIFDEIINHIEVKFQNGFSFDSANKYVHNGTFLRLSNVPEIGWRPDWESKYKQNN